MKIIPFGDRILVKRKVIGEKLGKEGIIVAVEETKDRPTDLAVVVHVPEHSFADNELIKGATVIIDGLIKKAGEGDAKALMALIQFNAFLKIKTIQPGDEIMISKYVGVTFHDNDGNTDMTLVRSDDIIGVTVK